MAEKQFANGLVVKRNPKAPVYAICALSFKTQEFIQYLKDHDNNGWVNVDVKLSQKGTYYAELNTYQKGQQAPKVEQEEKNQADLNQMDTIEYPTEEIDPSNIPF